MSDGEAFFDTSVLLYLLSSDAAKADRAETLLKGRGVVSVQILNEFASVARRKLGLSFIEIKEVLGAVRALCDIHALALEQHDRGLEIAERYHFAFYDSLIVASALLAGCRVLYTEDLQHRQIIEDRLMVRNPFENS